MNKLPTLTHPTFEVDIPSSRGKLKHKFRPMLVKEEKILLMAKKDGTNAAMYRAIESVLTACFQSVADNASQMIVPATNEIKKYTLFDLEYVFLKVRAHSMSNVVKVVYKDAEDGKDYPFEINLDELKVKGLDDSSKTEDFVVLLSEESGGKGNKGFQMRYPAAQIYASPVFSKSDVMPEDLLHELIVWCVESFFDGPERPFLFAQASRADIDAFMANLDLATYERLKDWVSNLPRLSYEITYTNSNRHERRIELNTLSEFFTL